MVTLDARKKLEDIQVAIADAIESAGIPVHVLNRYQKPFNAVPLPAVFITVLSAQVEMVSRAVNFATFLCSPTFSVTLVVKNQILEHLLFENYDLEMAILQTLSGRRFDGVLGQHVLMPEGFRDVTTEEYEAANIRLVSIRFSTKFQYQMLDESGLADAPNLSGLGINLFFPNGQTGDVTVIDGTYPTPGAGDPPTLALAPGNSRPWPLINFLAKITSVTNEACSVAFSFDGGNTWTDSAPIVQDSMPVPELLGIIVDFPGATGYTLGQIWKFTNIKAQDIVEFAGTPNMVFQGIGPEDMTVQLSPSWPVGRAFRGIVKVYESGAGTGPDQIITSLDGFNWTSPVDEVLNSPMVFAALPGNLQSLLTFTFTKQNHQTGDTWLVNITS